MTDTTPAPLALVPPQSDLDEDELLQVAAAVARALERWRADLDRTAADRTYVDVYSDEQLGVWAISSMADVHDPGFHDHDGSPRGGVVVEGWTRHEQLRLGKRATGRRVEAGGSCTFGPSFVHRMRREPGARRTITTGQHGQADEGLWHRWPGEAADQLRPHGGQRTRSEA